jgi:invasion protein IalB
MNLIKLTTAVATLAATILLPAAHAQPVAKAKGPSAPMAQAPSPAPSSQSAAPANSPPPPGWNARCGSGSREAPLECVIEQTAVLSQTGQLVALVSIRVPGDTRAPVALVQLPLGLNLPLGAKLQVDDGKAIDLPIQTCENRGCYANAPVTPDMLAALRTGKQLKISFQNLAKETMTIPLPLNDFASAYDKIK